MAHWWITTMVSEVCFWARRRRNDFANTGWPFYRRQGIRRLGHVLADRPTCHRWCGAVAAMHRLVAHGVWHHGMFGEVDMCVPPPPPRRFKAVGWHYQSGLARLNDFQIFQTASVCKMWETYFLLSKTTFLLGRSSNSKRNLNYKFRNKPSLNLAWVYLGSKPFGKNW
jgi:hypothetical protein